MEDEQIQDQSQDESVNNTPVQDDAASTPAEAPEAQGQEEAVQEQPKTEAEPKKKNNAQSRIKELLGENKAKDNQIQELMQRAGQLDVPDELTADQYRAMQFSGQLAQADVQQLRRELAYKDFTGEMNEVVNTVPELNPDSDSYNPDLEAVIAENYADGFIVKDQYGFVGTRKPFKEFALQQVKVFRNAQTKGATASKEVLDRQASEQAITSTGGSSKAPRDTSDKSIAELEKELGIFRA